MRLASRLLASVVAVALLAGCGGAVPADAAATVNGVEVPRERFESLVDASVGGIEETQGELSGDERTRVVEEQQRQLLTLLVQDTVITSVAADAGVEVDDADTAAIRSEILDSVDGEEQLEQLLVQDGLSLQLFDDVLVPQQARIVALRAQLAEGEDLETRTARHILLETREEADEVVADLEDGADFGELATERSTDPGSAAQGGELPASPRGAYVPEFEEAVWEAELDELVGPVETQFGFHVLEVLAEDVTPASELDDAQVGQLVDPQLNQLVAEAFEDAEVEIDPAFGEWDPSTRSVVPAGQVGEPQVPDGLDLGEPAPDEPAPGEQDQG